MIGALSPLPAYHPIDGAGRGSYRNTQQISITTVSSEALTDLRDTIKNRRIPT
jgi:hypothetical protein